MAGFHKRVMANADFATREKLVNLLVNSVMIYSNKAVVKGNIPVITTDALIPSHHVLPLHISASPSPRPKFTPFSAINIRSSGSNTKSNLIGDFWSPYNEELLDEDHLSAAKYSFLFAITSDRACAQAASRSTPFGGSRHSRSIA